MIINKPDIAEYVSKYVSLGRQGNKLWGRCPFHSEKIPSFTVSPEKQVYFCFGCQKGGDVIEFIKRYHNTDFNGALDIIGHKRPETKRERRAAARRIKLEQRERKRRHETELQGHEQGRQDFLRLAQLDYLITLTRDTVNLCRTMDDLEDISSAIHMVPIWEYERDCLQWKQQPSCR